MAEVENELIVEALAETVLSQPGNAKLEAALMEKVWERRQGELYARARAEVTQQEEEKWRVREERWQAQKVEEKRALVREASQLAELDMNRAMAAERDSFEERLTRVIGQRNTWKSRAMAAEEWVIDHIRHLLPDESYVLLRHAEITRLRLHVAARTI